MLKIHWASQTLQIHSITNRQREKHLTMIRKVWMMMQNKMRRTGRVKGSFELFVLLKIYKPCQMVIRSFFWIHRHYSASQTRMFSHIFSFTNTEYLLSCLAVPHACLGTPGLFIMALPADFNASMLRCVDYYDKQSSRGITALPWTVQ